MDKRLTLGSLFDGSGGFPLGGMLSGITPVWASEIEPFPIRVTTKRLPFMKHYGDVSRLNGADLEPVDIITFGSPCQDMSVAGRRAGLGGSRSNLFYEAVRIAKEMREATNGRYPTWLCWENVPGAFSSNAGADFKAVLDEIRKIKDPEADTPRPAKWPNAGLILADDYSVAWRVLDAQYWGVPQRRKRIYLVADLGGQRAGKVLFESEGLSGYTPKGFCSWQGTAGAAEERAHAAGVGTDGYNGAIAEVASTLGVNCGMSTGRNGVMVLNDQGGDRMDVTEDVTATLRAEAHHPPVVTEAAGFCTEHSAKARSVGFEEERSPTLRAGTVPAAVAIENYPTDGRAKICADDKVQTLTSRMGTGGNNVPLVMKIRCGCEGGGKGPLIQRDKSATLATNNDQTVFVPKAYGIGSNQSRGMLSDNPKAGFYEADTARTLDGNGGNPGCNQGGIAVVAFTQNQRDEVRDLKGRSGALATSPGTKQQTFILQGSMIGREDQNGPRGNGVNEDVSFTLNTTDRHAVASVYSASHSSFFTSATRDVAAALLATDHKDPPLVADDASAYLVRRLTPTECARLQGFPDWWCSGLETQEPSEEDIRFWREVFETYGKATGASGKAKTDAQIMKWLKSPGSDSAEYKLWGNGVALPCVHFVLSGIVWCEQISG